MKIFSVIAMEMVKNKLMFNKHISQPGRNFSLDFESTTKKSSSWENLILWISE